MAEQKGKAGKTDASKGERVGSSYPTHLYDNPLNANDELYEPGNTNKTLDGLSKNTIDHAGLPLRKGAYDKYYEGK